MSRRWAEAFHHIAARIPDFDVQNAALVATYQAYRPKIVVETTFADQLAAAIECITFAGFADTSPLQNRRKYAVRVDHEGKDIVGFGRHLYRRRSKQHDGIAATLQQAIGKYGRQYYRGELWCSQGTRNELQQARLFEVATHRARLVGCDNQTIMAYQEIAEVAFVGDHGL